MRMPPVGSLTVVALAAALATWPVHGNSAEVGKCAAATPKSCIGMKHSWDPYPGWWEDRHAKKLAQIEASGGEIDIVFIGDSITHNWEGARGPGSDFGGRPLAELKRQYSVLNLGFGGDGTQNVLWRLLNGELDGYTAKCFVLMVGTNNGGRPEDTATGIKAILDVIAAKQPLAKVVLHPIFPSGATADHPWRVRNSKVNALIRPFADGKRIIWCDFNERFLNSDGTLRKELMKPDDLHPAPPAYDIWAEALAPIFRKACTGVSFDFERLSAEIFEKDLGGVNMLPPDKRCVSPVKLVGTGKGPQDDAAQWRTKIVFGGDSARRLRIRFHYRASPEAGKPGRSIMFLFAREFNDKGYLYSVIGQTDEFFHLFSREFNIPQSVREIDLCLRVESHGTLEFKNIEAVEVKDDPSSPDVELFITPHGWLGRDFAVSSNGLAIVNYMWRRARAREKDAKCRYEFVATLPPGFRCVAPMNALSGTVREKTLPDGGMEVRYRIPMRPPQSGKFDWWGRQGLIVGTTAPHGTRGKAKFRLEIDGRTASNEESLELFVIPEIKAQAPEKFLYGVSFASPSGLLSGDAAADEAYARFMVGCGVRWVKGWGRKINPFDMWRRAGIKHAMAESPIGNAYSLYFGKAPEGERFVALHPKRSRWLEHAICPVAVYREKPFFMTNVVARINDVHAGADGSYANWEPFFYRREGCMCESCRDEFARWAQLPQEDVAKDWPDCIAREGRYGDRVVKFRSWQCAEVVRTLDKWIRKATGGESSLGLIPAVHREQITRNWVGVVDNAEFDTIDYGRDLAWVCPWGPYSGVWDASSPFVNPGTKWLMDFYNAREGAEAAHRDYPGLKLMAYPHGLQCSSWLIEPEILGLNLSAYFFNGWDAALVYFFPMGYDSRYWKAYADAVSLAAKWEGFIAGAERVDGKVEIVPGADWPKPDATAFHRTIASFRNVSFLQHVAYKKGDELLVAVFNYHPARRAFFTLRHDGVETQHTVPSARVKVFTFRGGKECAAASAAMSDSYMAIWNDKEQARIDADIERYRKADGVFNVDAPDGTAVKVEQLSHAFRFGAHSFKIGRLPTEELNRRYEENFARLFNQVTIDFYWRRFETLPGKPHFKTTEGDLESAFVSGERDRMTPHERYMASPSRSTDQYLEFAKKHGMIVHGHPLVWASASWMIPFWVYEKYCPQEEKDFLRLPYKDPGTISRLFAEWDWLNAYKARIAELKKLYTDDEIAVKCPVFISNMKKLWENRVAEILDYCGDRVDSWDVVNESVAEWEKYGTCKTGKPICVCPGDNYFLMPGDYTLEMFLLARRHASPRSLLAINDNSRWQKYASQVDDLLVHGARVDMVGAQFHIFRDEDFMRIVAGAEIIGRFPQTPEGIRRQFALLGRSGRPVNLSEITIPAPGLTPEAMRQQAVVAANLYRCWFSQPNACGITWWHSLDGASKDGGVENGSAGVMDAEGRPKPVYHALYDLIHRRWKTCVEAVAKDGKVTFRGFRGRYRISWQDAAKQNHSIQVELK